MIISFVTSKLVPYEHLERLNCEILEIKKVKTLSKDALSTTERIIPLNWNTYRKNTNISAK